jgi:NAD-dependent dihydropyrimidine dehydrogenase PreA subunit
LFLNVKHATLAVFTGTGNTLLMAGALAKKLGGAGLKVDIIPMERPEALKLPEDSALGLAAPLACCSTYPAAWRFIDSLPDGGGREAFFLATMGGMSLGMEGPVRRAVESKGYRPAGAAIVRMPRNYANRTIHSEENRALIENSRALVEKFAEDLLECRTSWRGDGLASRFFARLAHGRKPWHLFNRVFPIAVDPGKCASCGICAEICPEKNISLSGGTANIGANCQSCQRCVAYCPENAIAVPGKPAEQYRAMPLDEFKTALGLDKKIA